MMMFDRGFDDSWDSVTVTRRLPAVTERSSGQGERKPRLQGFGQPAGFLLAGQFERLTGDLHSFGETAGLGIGRSQGIQNRRLPSTREPGGALGQGHGLGAIA